MPVDVRGYVRIRALDPVQCPNPELDQATVAAGYWAGDVAGERGDHPPNS
jgi:hypothetical protein